MALDYTATSKKIVDAVGGVGNIAGASHCMTRLRLVLKDEGKVYAPCDAAVSQMMDSRHAIGLVADNGVEILIHVGLDTVQLEGKPFTYHVKADQEVKKGDLLLTADLDAITKAGKKLYTPVIITNSDDYVNIDPVQPGEIKAGQKLITVS